MEHSKKRNRGKAVKKSSTESTSPYNTGTSSVIEGRVLRSRAKDLALAAPPPPSFTSRPPSPPPRPSTRIQQPNVYINRNLTKIKMEVDFVPEIKIEPEEIKTETDLDPGVPSFVIGEAEGLNSDGNFETLVPQRKRQKGNGDFPQSEEEELLRTFKEEDEGGAANVLDVAPPPLLSLNIENQHPKGNFSVRNRQEMTMKEETAEPIEIPATLPSQTLLKNKALLPLILEKSTTLDLLAYRLVSQQWKNVATKILLARGSLKIRFEIFKNERYARIAKWSSKFERSTFYSSAKAEKVHPRKFCFRHSILKSDQFWDSIGDRTLPGLLQVLNPETVSSSLPVTHFDLYIRELDQDVIPEQIVSFFEYYGPNITALTLDNNIDSILSKRGITNFILRRTPNLQSLKISARSSDMRTSYQRLTAKDKFILRHLKYIEIDAEHHDKNLDDFCGHFLWLSAVTVSTFLPHLLEIAPKLERLTLGHLGRPLLLQSLPPSKIDLFELQSLSLTERELFLEQSLENLIEVMEQSTKDVGLKRLQICVESWPPDSKSWKQGNTALRRLFGANVDSLQEIVLLSGASVCLHRMRGLPSLPKVTKIFVTPDFCRTFELGKLDTDALDLVATPRGEKEGVLSLLFPNVETFEWKQEESEACLQKLLLPWNTKLRRVKTLKIRNFNVIEVLKLMKICPEVTNLQCYAPYRDLSTLWNYTQLTSLTLKLSCWDKEDSFLKLDAALTGLDRETVSAIYNNWKECGRWEYIGEGASMPVPRVTPSILHLSNLKKFQLKYNIWQFNKLNSYEPKIYVSGVSAKFGFALLENLEVLITFTSESLKFPKCPDYDRETVARKRVKLLQLHQPLLSFSNVTLSIE